MLNKYLLPKQEVVESIHFIRDQKVMLDFDLASLYEIRTKRSNEHVKRNNGHFPNDFMFQLTENEWLILRSLNTTANLENQFFRQRSISGLIKMSFKLNY